jgi:hypothetical protein
MAEKNTGADTKKVTHPNIHAALSAFQGEMKPLPKTKKASFDTRGGAKVEYSWTPLGETMEKIAPLLSKHGLAVRHEIENDGIRDGVVAILTHETYKERYERLSTKKETRKLDGSSETTEGEQLVKMTENEIRSGRVEIPKGGEMKDIGAAITYARRYSLTMVLGISSDDDTDVQLLTDSAKNAVQFAYNKAKQGLEGAKDAKAIDKALEVLKKDLKTLEGGKAPALGLSKDQYEDLILYADQLKADKFTNQPEEKNRNK